MSRILRGFFLFGIIYLLNISAAFSQCDSTLATPFTFNNGQAGIMFTITAKNSIVIDSFDVNFDPGTIPYEIFFKPGGVVGFQTTPAAWTSLGTGTATSAGAGNATNLALSLNVQLNKYETGSFYITATTGTPMNYTNGTTICDSLLGNPDLKIHEGYGKAYPFAATFIPREFSGRVYYHCLPTPNYQVVAPNLCNATPGQTVQIAINPPLTGPNFTWTLPAGMTIVGSQNNDSITVSLTANSFSGNICVTADDCGGNIVTLCDPVYQASPPPIQGPITGPTSVCVGDTVTYWVPLDSLASAYYWAIPATDTIISSATDSLIQLVIGPNSSGGQICASYTDTCAYSNSTCLTYIVPAITPSNAGADIYNCDSDVPVLNGNNPANGAGVWSVISSPAGGAGVFADSSVNSTTYSGGAPGVHTLQWEISNGNCPSSSDVMEVHVAGTPTAAFSFSNECDGSSVTFTDQTIANGTNISSWSWDLTNDGNANTLSQNTSYVYNSPGSKIVRLIVTSLGCSDTATNIVNVYPRPNLNVVGLNACDESAVVYNNSSTILSGTIDSISWEYGDGTLGNGVGNSSHIFSTPGSYVTTVTAFSNNGCESQAIVPVEVYSNPTALFDYVNACQFQELSFQNQSTVAGASITSYAWSMGDGSTSSLKDPTYTYNSNGVQNVNLFVTTNQSCVDDTTIEVEIFPTPVSEYNYSNKVCEGQATTFDQVSSISYGSIVNYEWFLHDDSLYFYGEEMTYSFPEKGEYKVSLTSISDQGCEHTIEKNIPVFAMPVADFSIVNACAGDEVPTQNISSSADPISNFYWDFDDGSQVITEYNPVHTYDSFGIFNVSLRAETFKGCISEKEVAIEVYEIPNINYQLSVDSGCSPMVVSFIDSSTMSSADSYSYMWRAGSNPFVRATTDTLYNYSGKDQFLPVEAVFTSSNGCVSEIVNDSLVQIRPQPRAAFSFSPTTISATDPFVQFTDESRDANYWGWEFGDGTTDKERNPAKLYAEAGEYQVTFWTRNIFNCVDTATALLVVEPGNRLFVPNSFSPNQDLLNDEFQIFGLETATEAVLRVYDRWGHLVWRGDILNASWDGTNQKGKRVADGVYLIYLKYSINDRVFEFNNSVTVLGAE